MSAHRLPMYGTPTRFSRGMAGFFKIVTQGGEIEGLPIAAKWPMENSSLEDTEGSRDLSIASGSPNFVTGVVGNAAEIDTYTGFEVNYPSMFLSSWEIELDVKFSSFTEIDTNLYAHVISYGKISGLEREWELWVERDSGGTNYIFSFFSNNSGAALRSDPLAINQWYHLRLGYVAATVSVAGKIYWSIDSSVEENQPTNTTIIFYSGRLRIGATGSDNALTYMTIDEVTLKQVLTTGGGGALSASHLWTLNTSAWIDDIGGDFLSETSPVTIVSGTIANAAEFDTYSNLFVDISSMSGGSWQIDLWVRFESFDFMGHTEAYIAYFNNDPSIDLDWHLSLLDGVTKQIRFRSARFNKTITTGSISTSTWYNIKFGYRSASQILFLQIGSNPELTDTAGPAPTVSTGRLTLGALNETFATIAGMRLDNVEIKQGI